jgi:hypothetical protein
MKEYRNDAWLPDPDSDSDKISVHGGSDYANFPKVVMDPNGDAVIIWRQTDPSDMQIFMSEFR